MRYGIKEILESYRKRGAHAYLMNGEDMGELERAGIYFAGEILKDNIDIHKGYPDLHILRPMNKMRQINVDAVREFNRNIYYTSTFGKGKVGIIIEADRMNVAASNAFLKTLEEPPEDTVFLLLTTQKYRVLPTVQSRCFRVNLQTSANNIYSDNWNEWLNRYQDWLQKVYNNEDKTGELIEMYGLVYEFGIELDRMGESELKEKKGLILETWTGEETEAFETGIVKGVRERLIKSIGKRTRDCYYEVFGSRVVERSFLLKESIGLLEETMRLLVFNFNEQGALEFFMLKMRELWGKKYLTK